VRELENAIERAVLINAGPEILAESLFPALVNTDDAVVSQSLFDTINGTKEVLEREKIAEALKKTSGNRSHAARLLGISRSALYNKLKLLGQLQ
jgi:DNA-binding NtrC family response regulator